MPFYNIPNGVDAGQINSGTLPDARLSENVVLVDGTGKVPASKLPSYVDDVLEYSSLAAFPPAGESGKIYVAVDTSKAYRWSGSTYAEVSSTSEAPVQSVAGKTGAVTLAKSDVGLGNVDNTSDANKPVSTATQTALDGKAASSHSHAAATTSAAGFMSAADKQLLASAIQPMGSASFGTLGVGAGSQEGGWLYVDIQGRVMYGQWQAAPIGVAYGGTGANNAADAVTNIGAAAKSSTEVFISSGTWVKPSGARAVLITVVGGGGGGGGGRASVAGSGTAAGGGGGGGAGGRTVELISADALPGAVSVAVGSGGAGGLGSSDFPANGSGGGNGGASHFGITQALSWASALGGGGGGGGTVSPGASGIAAARSLYTPSAGGVGGRDTSGSPSQGSYGAPTGGGGGGGINASGSAFGPGLAMWPRATYGFPVTPTGGMDGASVPVGLPLPGGGGSGGFCAISPEQEKRDGGNGGKYGGGGGGGGGSLSQRSGNGGAGAPGIVTVTTFF